MRLHCTRAASTVDAHLFLPRAELSSRPKQSLRHQPITQSRGGGGKMCEPSGRDEHENDIHRNLKKYIHHEENNRRRNKSMSASQRNRSKTKQKSVVT
jgi:aromatic ring hydroxylase